MGHPHKIAKVREYYDEQSIPPVRVGMVHLLSALSETKKENEEFLKYSYSRFSDGTDRERQNIILNKGIWSL